MSTTEETQDQPQANLEPTVYITPRFCVTCGDRHTTDNTMCERCYTPPTFICNVCNKDMVPEIAGEKTCGDCMVFLTKVSASEPFKRMVKDCVLECLAEKEKEDAPAVDQAPLRCINCGCVYMVPPDQVGWRQVCGPCYSSGVRPPPKPRTTTTKRMRTVFKQNE